MLSIRMPSAFTPLTYVSSHSSVLIFREATKHPHLIFPLNGPLLSSINKSFNSSETIYLLINAGLMSPCVFITYFHLLSKALPLKKLQVLKICVLSISLGFMFSSIFYSSERSPSPKQVIQHIFLHQPQ